DAITEGAFQWMLTRYQRALDWCLERRPVVLGMFFATVVASALLFVLVPKGFFPTEDTGILMVQVEGPQDVSFPAMRDLHVRVAEVVAKDPAVHAVTSFVGGGPTSAVNAGRLFVELKDQSDRPSLSRVLQNLRRDVAPIPG